MITNQVFIAYHIVNGAVNAETDKAFLSSNLANHTLGQVGKRSILDIFRFNIMQKLEIYAKKEVLTFYFCIWHFV